MRVYTFANHSGVSSQKEEGKQGSYNNKAATAEVFSGFGEVNGNTDQIKLRIQGGIR